MIQPEPAGEIVAMIAALRAEEGHTVTILSDNPEADSIEEQSGVEVCGDWTNWEQRRFLGRHWANGLRAAFETMLHETGRQP
jgi:hypothetical protein